MQNEPENGKGQRQADKSGAKQMNDSKQEEPFKGDSEETETEDLADDQDKQGELEKTESEELAEDDAGIFATFGFEE